MSILNNLSAAYLAWYLVFGIAATLTVLGFILSIREQLRGKPTVSAKARTTYPRSRISVKEEASTPIIVDADPVPTRQYWH